MIEAVIFDMDGVISDTQKLHAKIESEILNRFGIPITPDEITEKYAGVKTTEFISELLNRNGSKFDLAELMKEKWDMMEKLSKSRVDEIPGAISLIKMLDKAKTKLAVASASNTNYALSVLDKLGIRNYFGAVVTGEMVLKGKPDPQIFLLAAKKIDAEPGECVVIEDGRSGIQAANAAGMKSIGLVKNMNSDFPTNNLVISLSEITIEYLNNLN
ncbi:MAG: HAD family phosphatase [Patescibacteria group bacterium]|jgi:beta-phosphoglucomutase family hydrolase